jgi:hypothetical protein
MPYAEVTIENKGPYRSLKDDGTAFILFDKAATTGL